jgi:tetratricopeptide (TPR) repeat protein
MMKKDVQGNAVFSQNRNFSFVMLNFRRKSIFFLFAFLFVCGSFSHAQGVREKQLIESIKKETNETRKFRRMLALGEYYKGNNLQRADSIKDVLLQRSRVFDDSLRFSALMYNAEINLLMGRQEEYFRDVLGCQSFLSRLNADEVTYKIFRHLGSYHSNLMEFETADFYLRNSRKLARNMRNNSQVSESNSFLALNFMFQNKKDSALYYTDQAIQFARRTSNKSVLAESFNTQARVYAYFGQIELSVAKNVISLQLALEANDPILLSKYHREIGIAQRSISNLDDAEYYFKQSYDYASRVSDKRQMGLANMNLGTVYFDRKEYRKAIDMMQRSIRLLGDLNDFNGLGEGHNNLGMIYREMKDYPKAASNFNKALVFYESTGNKERIADVYHNVGTVFQKQGKYANALNYLQRSIEIREQFGSKNLIYLSYRAMSEVYKDIGKKDDALKYLHLYLDYQDSNTIVQSAAKIAELSESYRSEQRDRLILLQQDSIQRQLQEREMTSTKLENIQLRNNFQTYIIIAFLIIVGLGAWLIVSRWKQNQIKQQQKEAEMSQTLLRTQMNPHFVFNAMSVIQSYIYENDIENSSKFLVNFSRLMRLILENSPKEFIPLETEIEILQKYLTTQKLRFEDRFEYSIDCAQELLDEGGMIPPMITQPFIENAIEHGQLHTIEGGFIHVYFSKRGDMMDILIEDNGIGRKGAEQNKKSKEHKSMALSITRERIDNLSKKYRTEGTLEIEDFDKVLNTGTKVLISLPFKTENPNTASI